MGAPPLILAGDADSTWTPGVWLHLTAADGPATVQRPGPGGRYHDRPPGLPSSVTMAHRRLEAAPGLPSSAGTPATSAR